MFPLCVVYLNIPIVLAVLQTGPLAAATAPLQRRKRGMQSFSRRTRNGQIVSNEVSGSEMREF